MTPMPIREMSRTLPGAVCFSLLFLLQHVMVLGQQTEMIQLNWKGPVKTEAGVYRLNFEGVRFETAEPGRPFYYKNLPSSQLEIVFTPGATQPLTPEEEVAVTADPGISFAFSVETATERKVPTTFFRLCPIRRIQGSGKYEKLISFQLQYTPSATPAAQRPQGAPNFAPRSVLASGDWYKFGVTRDGIYKVTFTQLLNAGMDPAQLSIPSIRVFGNGGGLLPVVNSAPRKDDLQECAIQVTDANQDGLFNGNDYLLFYGQGQVRWTYSSTEKKFLHLNNHYSDTTYYFITANAGGTPKRITTIAELPPSPADPLVTTFPDYDFYEKDERNYIKSGRQWYGEVFDVILNQKFNFSFPGIIPGPVKIRSSVVGRTVTDFSSASQFNVACNAVPVLTHSIGNVTSNYTSDFGRPSIQNGVFNTSAADLEVEYTFLPYNATATGYLDFIELNATRSLRFGGNSLTFRYLDTTGTGGNLRYNISNAGTGLTLWNISDHNQVGAQDYTLLNGLLSFTAPVSAGGLAEYCLFNQNATIAPFFAGKVANQNLHGLAQAPYLIITHPLFYTEAQRLAAFHQQNDQLASHVVNVYDIYNEFSGGAQDATALRDFIRMFYERSTTPSDLPKYVLLFGDGSYELKYRLSNNTNYIPTYQSVESLSLIGSYTCDDFFGLLDPAEGDFFGTELMDAGIGRFPVRTTEEAREMVDKVITYSTVGVISDQTFCAGTNSTRLGDWRNMVCFIADDQDRNLHQDQSERITQIVQSNFPAYNIDKILSDAYQQVSTPGGQRYPEVNDAITKRVEKGALLMNYTGHGGELGWASESILNNDMINSWSNLNNMPAFITATCEFSRFDDPQRTSAGEFVLLNPTGGGICLFTTVRLALAFDNELINSDMLRHFFAPIAGEMPRTGDIIRLSKRDNPGNRNVTLLGDPALQLAYPKYRVTTTAIEETGTGLPMDTLSALSHVTIRGKVTDENGNVLTGFNGVVYPTIYDKEAKIYTVVNDKTGSDISLPDSFNLRKNILYKGKATVTNGAFSCSFIVPRDISFQYGSGRISYYAHNGADDATGFDQNFQIGGFSASGLNDQTGPVVQLYMNDENFVFGSITNSTPTIYAVLFDSSGINMVGNGIGHDITAMVDNNPRQLFVLNDFYESDKDSYQRGRVRYRLDELSEGPHTLTFKAWDINNNSSEATTEFVVSSSAGLALDHVLNYPNPFTTKTRFMFEHNKPCTGMAIQVQIFTVTGKLVKTLDAYQVCEGFRNIPMEWDGRDDFGDQLARGVYIYRLRIRTAEGETAQKTERLVLIR